MKVKLDENVTTLINMFSVDDDQNGFFKPDLLYRQDVEHLDLEHVQSCLGFQSFPHERLPMECLPSTRPINCQEQDWTNTLKEFQGPLCTS